jgi:hypothetical protein
MQNSDASSLEPISKITSPNFVEDKRVETYALVASLDRVCERTAFFLDKHYWKGQPTHHPERTDNKAVFTVELAELFEQLHAIARIHLIDTGRGVIQVGFDYLRLRDLPHDDSRFPPDGVFQLSNTFGEFNSCLRMNMEQLFRIRHGENLEYDAGRDTNLWAKEYQDHYGYTLGINGRTELDEIRAKNKAAALELGWRVTDEWPELAFVLPYRLSS